MYVLCIIRFKCCKIGKGIAIKKIIFLKATKHLHFSLVRHCLVKVVQLHRTFSFPFTISHKNKLSRT